MASQTVPVLLADPRYGWKDIASGQWRGCFAGEAEAARQALALLPAGGEAPAPGDLDRLAGVGGFYGLMAESPRTAFACVDMTRSYPVFHSGRGGCTVSNSARTLRAAKGMGEADPRSVLEMALAGYVTGSRTMLAGLDQLQAGECLAWDKTEAEPRVHRYYIYRPRPESGRDEAEWLRELGEATDAVCARTLELAAGRPLWVPLSGGLDSRLLLCKFVEMGCSRIQAFSYGPPHNDEARIARRVAKRLGVPWFFVPCRRAAARQWFQSPQRREFWEYSDGLCVIPFMQDIAVLGDLLAAGRMPPDAFVVNGQSGDFISGGHVPEALLDPAADRAAMFQAMLRKHLSLWPALHTARNLTELQTGIERDLGCRSGEAQDAAAAYEQWEWQERQCKYVVGGQRAYDFHGLAWDLPLWGKPYLDFWRRVPTSLKWGQRLYKAYLRAYDYRGLFRDFNPTVWRWPGAFKVVPVVAQLVGLAGGRSAKQKFYKYMEYFGHYSDKYAAYPYREYLRELGKAKNVMALYVRTWFRENGFAFPGGDARAHNA
jgi:asparagine synthase (glutamine-hydrolysing)